MQDGNYWICEKYQDFVDQMRKYFKLKVVTLILSLLLIEDVLAEVIKLPVSLKAFQDIHGESIDQPTALVEPIKYNVNAYYDERYIGVESLLMSAYTENSKDASIRNPDENTAFILSLFGTLVPIGTGIAFISSSMHKYSVPRTLIGSGILWSGPLVGPSLGYYYGGLNIRARSGILIRTAIFGFTWLIAPTKDFNDGFLPNPNLDTFGFWLITTPIILIYDAVDIASVKSAVRKETERKQALSIILAPDYFKESDARGFTLRIVF